MSVFVHTCKPIRLERKQIYRYLGLKQSPDEALKTHIERIAEHAEAEASCRISYCSVPFELSGDRISFGAFPTVESRKLADNLRGTSRALLFCATCGSYFDRKIAAARLQPSQAVIWDAVGTAAIEQFCDGFCAEQKTVRSRFSPGYGDLPLAFQKELLQWLRATQTIGVGLTDSLLMTPTKSVSAIAAQE